MKLSNALTVIAVMATSAIAVPVGDAPPAGDASAAETQVEKRCLGGGYGECVAIATQTCNLKCLRPRGKVACMIQCSIQVQKDCASDCSK